MKKKFIYSLACLPMLLLSTASLKAETVQLEFDNVPQIVFGVDKIKLALKQQHHSMVIQDAQIKILISIEPTDKKAESFSISRKGSEIKVLGQDAAGAMYGALELAELIRIGDLEISQAIEQSPYMDMRGTKFNIPLGARTPGFSDGGEAAQHNLSEMWSFDFWKSYIDRLAEQRYNFISLWNLHPFPTLVKVPEYPDVALDDVYQSDMKWKEYDFRFGVGYDDPEYINNLKIIKKISIDEKIAFWKKVMHYGKERNVDFYFVTWNIFVYGTDGKYGITDSIDNETTIDYTRQSVKQMFLTYPDLAGIGLTTGENMHDIKTVDKEDWAYKTYGEGVLDAAKELPDRKMTLIHRQHMSGAIEIADRFKALTNQTNTDFIFSFKYAGARVMSSTIQPNHQIFVEDIQKRNDLKTIWTLRNDDNYYFRWGAPDFVREFIQNIPYEVSRGFYYGSDGYIWGREFLSLHPETPRQMEVDKHWYHWMLWGRLGYNPQLTNTRLIQILQARFPKVDAKQLFTAWQSASMIYPLTSGFHYARSDYLWFLEGCRSDPRNSGTNSGFHDVNRFITFDVHESTDNIPIPIYTKSILDKKKIKGTTPFQVSEKIHAHADRALLILENLKADEKELEQTLVDIRCMAYLGKYYAHKITGATELSLYRDVKNKQHQENAIRELTKAADYWRHFTNTAKSQYKNPLRSNRVGIVDWEKTYIDVLGDIEIAKQ